MRMLVIEDDVDVREMITKILKDEGYDVAEANNGVEGIKYLKDASEIDCIVTDLIMPEKEGIETIIDVKRDYPNIKILAISGGGKGNAQNYLHIAKAMGADLTLSKPFIKKELIDAIQQLIVTS
ncbi:response regulator [candidate division KSB1 bacterium]|nr:response regulator [candidate division KSB1 bacterium]